MCVVVMCVVVMCVVATGVRVVMGDDGCCDFFSLIILTENGMVFSIKTQNK